jgi:hypothetical protein
LDFKKYFWSSRPFDALSKGCECIQKYNNLKIIVWLPLKKIKVTWFVMELYNLKFNLWPEHLALNGLKPCSISKGIKRNSKYLTKVTENYNDAKTTSTVLERNRHTK